LRGTSEDHASPAGGEAKRRRCGIEVRVVLGVVLLIIYAGSILLVARTGDLGGRLAHRSGQHVHVDNRTIRRMKHRIRCNRCIRN